MGTSLVVKFRRLNPSEAEDFCGLPRVRKGLECRIRSTRRHGPRICEFLQLLEVQATAQRLGKPPANGVDLTRIIQRGGVRSGDAADRGVIFRGVEDAGIGV
jgi:hypothetical protein